LKGNKEEKSAEGKSGWRGGGSGGDCMELSDWSFVMAVGMLRCTMGRAVAA